MKNEDLRKRTKEFALRVIRLYSSLPTHTAARIICKKILRSGTSVGANYCEGCRARSPQEFTAKLGICLQKLEETAYWLELLIDSNLIKRETIEPVLKENNELTAILVSSINTLKKKSK